MPIPALCSPPTRPTLATYVAKREDLEATSKELFDIVISGKFDPAQMMQLFMQVTKSALPLGMLTKFALLLNLPFAVGAIMYGYESLFGSRQSRAA